MQRYKRNRTLRDLLLKENNQQYKTFYGLEMNEPAGYLYCYFFNTCFKKKKEKKKRPPHESSEQRQMLRRSHKLILNPSLSGDLSPLSFHPHENDEVRFSACSSQLYHTCAPSHRRFFPGLFFFFFSTSVWEKKTNFRAQRIKIFTLPTAGLLNSQF